MGALVFLLGPMTGSPGAATPALAGLFDGTAHLVEDGSFAGPPELQGHVETATARIGSRYVMAYRTYRSPEARQLAGGCRSATDPDTYAPDIQGIAVATSTDGDRWTAVDCGLPTLSGTAFRRFQANPLLDPFPSVYAPALHYDEASRRLTMFVEVDLRNYTKCPCQAIYSTTSTDEGMTWTAPVLVARGSRGSWTGMNVGTPSVLRRREGGYYVGYHGYTDLGTAPGLQRGYLSGDSLETLRDHRAPVFDGGGQAWSSFGVGRGDVVYDPRDGFYYMVFEGFRGNPHCGDPSEASGWGIARSRDLRHWVPSPDNPIRLDHAREPGGTLFCGQDMPSFQQIGSSTYVIVTDPDQVRADHRPKGRATVLRFKLAPTGG
jgi:hypothetical protein